MVATATDVVAQIIGWVATICFAFLLAPQILLNYSRKSTEGLSVALVLLWHMSAICMFPYLFNVHADVALQIQWMLFCVASVVLEVQITQYRPRTPTHPKPPSQLFLLGLAGLYSAITTSLIIALIFLFDFVDRTRASWLIQALGSVCASVFLAVGFLPQIYVMCKTKSSEGFSLGLSALDLTGSSLSIVNIVLIGGAHADVASVVPYAIIIMFQVVVVTLALVVYPGDKRGLRKLVTSLSLSHGSGEFGQRRDMEVTEDLDMDGSVVGVGGSNGVRDEEEGHIRGGIHDPRL